MIYLMLIDSEEHKAKFEIMYYEYRNLLFYVAKGMLQNDADAEDAVHETFLRTINLLDKIEEPVCLKTKHLLVIIVKRVSIDKLRSSKTRKVEISFDEMGDIVHSENKFENVENKIDLVRAIKEIPEQYQQAIVLKFYYDYSYKNIAAVMDISEANARKIVQRACNKLKELLGGREV